jgi:hypothetical protein
MQALSQLSYTPVPSRKTSRSRPRQGSFEPRCSSEPVSITNPQKPATAASTVSRSNRASTASMTGRLRAAADQHAHGRRQLRHLHLVRGQRVLHRLRDAGLVPVGRGQRSRRPCSAGAGSVTCVAGLRRWAWPARRASCSQSASSTTVLQRSLNSAHWRVQAAPGLASRCHAGQLLRHQAGQPRVVGLLHVLRVDPGQLGRVPLRRALARWLPSNHCTICSRLKSSSSPWLQPRRAR